MLKKILVPVDFSDTSLAGLREAGELADGTAAELVLLHVDEFPVMPIGEFPYLPTDVVEEHVAALKRRMNELVAQTTTGLRIVRGSIVAGPAYQAIIDAATAEKADLIVMGTHGRRGFRHLIMGSVAERVVRTASVPVLTVRLDPDQQAAKLPPAPAHGA